MSLDHADGFVKSQTPTEDAFLGGRLMVSQPRHGFRAGLDSVLLGASVKAKGGAVLDLGAGAGTAALVALAHDDAASAVLAERDAEMVRLATDNLTRNKFSARGNAIVVDVTASGAERAAAGLRTDYYASVIANPPFFDAAAGTRAAGGRAQARHMDAEALDKWIRAAATSAAPDGEIIFIFPASGLADLLECCARRFGGITVLPLVARPGRAVSRILLRARKGSRAPFNLLESCALHDEEGRGFSARFEAIFRGKARLDW